MSKAVLISIRPKWCELIASGEKNIEVRKTRPKQETPFKCYIYCTLSGSNEFFRETLGGDVAVWNRSRMAEKKGNVIGEFICDRVFDIEFDEDEGYNETYTPLGFHDCLTDEEFDRYLGAKDGSGWHISNLVIYDEPKQLSEFMKPCDPDPDGVPLCLQCKRLGENWCGGTILRPPQSWCYVEELE